jgi:hypothetical protein
LLSSVRAKLKLGLMRSFILVCYGSQVCRPFLSEWDLDQCRP